jgi:hypothetical protein
VENSWLTPDIFMEVTALPSIEESKTLRNELPKVTPKPFSKGAAENLP